MLTVAANYLINFFMNMHFSESVKFVPLETSWIRPTDVTWKTRFR